jgi:carboxypeptidase Q
MRFLLFLIRSITPASMLLCGLLATAQESLIQTAPARGAASDAPQADDPIARIREEGLNRSQITQTLSYLTDVIGPRLTGSPNLKRANEWTRDTLSSWGLVNADVEPWGEFGRGWTLERFSAHIVEPYPFPLVGFPRAWSPGFDQPLTAEVIYFDAKTEEDLEQYRGKLKNAIVLISPVREVRARFEPLASRLADTNLLRLANAGLPGGRSTRPAPPSVASTNRPAASAGSTAPSTAAQTNQAPPSRQLGISRMLSFLAEEEAALLVTSSSRGDGGTVFVTGVSVPPQKVAGGGTPRAWAAEPPAVPPQVTLAVEDYNRLVRMIQFGERLTMRVELQVKFHEEDLMAYNTVAEIPGSDLKHEVVMLGGHLDSWHVGTGATDNASGVAAAMEAVRILKALDLQPRRTIRVALWTGEEQGLLGSRAYVTKHFGYYTNITETTISSSGESQESNPGQTPPASRQTRQLVRLPDYENFSAYFNLDNGTGKIRGIYMQGNEAVRPIFREWLQPFHDLGAETVTVSNTGGTDHIPFDSIGLPGFQFIQDPIEYSSRTHHSTADVFERLQIDDLKQAAVIMAAFAYNAAMLDEKLPRKYATSSNSGAIDPPL